MTTIRPALSIGSVLGDYDLENKAWLAAIAALRDKASILANATDSPLRLNVVFHVHGKLAPNEFEGVRTGRFSKKDSQLMVQAAVPSVATDDRRAILLQLLRDAVSEAEAFAKRRGIAESLDGIRAIVRQVASE